MDIQSFDDSKDAAETCWLCQNTAFVTTGDFCLSPILSTRESLETSSVFFREDPSLLTLVMVDEEFCRLFFLQAGATLRTPGPPVADQGAHAGATASNHLLRLDTLDHVQRILVNYFTSCRLL